MKKTVIILVIFCAFFISACSTEEHHNKVDELKVNDEIEVVIVKKGKDFYIATYLDQVEKSEKKLVIDSNSTKYIEPQTAELIRAFQNDNTYTVTIDYSFIFNIKREVETIRFYAIISSKGKIMELYNELYNLEHIF